MCLDAGKEAGEPSAATHPLIGYPAAGTNSKFPPFKRPSLIELDFPFHCGLGGWNYISHLYLYKLRVTESVAGAYHAVRHLYNWIKYCWLHIQILSDIFIPFWRDIGVQSRSFFYITNSFLYCSALFIIKKSFSLFFDNEYTVFNRFSLNLLSTAARFFGEVVRPLGTTA